MSRSLFLAFVLSVFSAGSASATAVPFEAIKCSNPSSGCATIGAQLSVELVSVAGGKVGFLLHNVGSESLNATGIYFDDAANVLADLFDVSDFSGVDFAEGGKKKLKGGKKIEFITEFLATATKPSKDNGVDPGQMVQINFLLTNGKTIEQVRAALESGSLRVGVNAKQGYVTATGSVPEPALGMLLALGGLSAAWVARRS